MSRSAALNAARIMRHHHQQFHPRQRSPRSNLFSAMHHPGSRGAPSSSRQHATMTSTALSPTSAPKALREPPPLDLLASADMSKLTTTSRSARGPPGQPSYIAPNYFNILATVHESEMQTSGSASAPPRSGSLAGPSSGVSAPCSSAPAIELNDAAAGGNSALRQLTPTLALMPDPDDHEATPPGKGKMIESVDDEKENVSMLDVEEVKSNDLSRGSSPSAGEREVKEGALSALDKSKSISSSSGNLMARAESFPTFDTTPNMNDEEPSLDATLQYLSGWAAAAMGGLLAADGAPDSVCDDTRIAPATADAVGTAALAQLASTASATASAGHSATASAVRAGASAEPSTHLPCGLLNDGYYERFFFEVEFLGRGSFGHVFHCRHMIDGETLGDFALKKVAVGDDRTWLRKIIREVKAFERLNHPNVVQYKHSWLENWQANPWCPRVPFLFILMQYCSRGSLQDLIDRSCGADRGGLPVNMIFPLLDDILSGIHYLHTQGVLHRDLKCENVLLHCEGPLKTTRALLTDFGTAEWKTAAFSVGVDVEEAHNLASTSDNHHARGSSSTSTAQNTTAPAQQIGALRGNAATSSGNNPSRPGGIANGQPGSLRPDTTRSRSPLRERRSQQAGTGSSNFGTTEYMAPEAFHSVDPFYDEKSDMWSLGVLCYNMLFGKLPFFGNSPLATRLLIEKFSRGELLPADLQARPSGDGQSGSLILTALVFTLLQPEGARRPSAIDVLRNDAYCKARDRAAAAEFAFESSRERSGTGQASDRKRPLPITTTSEATS
ncbi:unnamed protein product [Amoebophrya sp. A25]|nr:unnamed protein product [Amoebophrya sp. A25]|eukprot:GSA25T00002279001.1